MRVSARIFFFTILLLSSAQARAQNAVFWGGLEPGPYTPGFKLVEVRDHSRVYPGQNPGVGTARKIRVYYWYPAEATGQPSLRFEAFVRMAADDFGLIPNSARTEEGLLPLPVPLAKGMDRDRLETLFECPAASVRDARPAAGSFPLLVLGQGLYYESPLSHFVMCEFLASHGYIVATCPLVGTQYRLVNRNTEDLETEIRDMEAVLAYARTQPNVRPEEVGVIGYDLGGMAGLLLCMRNPDIGAFLSLDSGILYPNRIGIPGSHPSYREDRFVIPWMHITQARWIRFYRDEMKLPDLFGRKFFGDSYLVQVPTENHGLFSSYALMGIRSAVPGYWGPPEEDAVALHEAVCRYALAFIDAHLQQDRGRLETILAAAGGSGAVGPTLTMEFKEGRIAPPSKDEIIHLIIEKGMAGARSVIDKTRAAFSTDDLFDEDVLNWLGYHFLYWWGREEEAVEVFELTVTLFPDSANAYDSLGEAHALLGRTEAATRAYETSLKINPDNKNAAAALVRLKKK